ncbi:hypothetical protein EHRUM4_10460 [Ehrlichia ruminantium]|uniref:Uncharacterized protein n=1 Tax=Ehrlichia ruminantium TaxID=779 RepID=A0A170S9V8_EHRRU|nr:hypothetical protein [Ehrlichia ruminantium]GAT75818.1 hypothetical protein EHRUM4_10460 [Ehrlichia ruminantium]GAT77784.1 hypothetical protein EHRUM2_10150 [Ehrlichia ruminantium]GAT78975.1 hypothetical protein EHRUM3_12090 [Ehrlichia ruminantium]
MDILNTNNETGSDIVYTEYPVSYSADQEPFVNLMITLSPTQTEHQYLVELLIEATNLDKGVLQSLYGKLTATLADNSLVLKYDDVSISLNRDSLLSLFNNIKVNKNTSLTE